jgi:hypothetical protein
MSSLLVLLDVRDMALGLGGCNVLLRRPVSLTDHLREKEWAKTDIVSPIEQR